MKFISALKGGDFFHNSLNRYGFTFEVHANRIALIDKVKQIYINVTENDVVPAQFLYARAKQQITEITYFGIATEFELRLYQMPPFHEIVAFAKQIDPEMNIPSNTVPREYNHDAVRLLGTHTHIWDYNTEFMFENEQKYLFITQKNDTYFRSVFEKYQINFSHFILFISQVYDRNEEIGVTENGWIQNNTSGVVFTNRETGTSMGTHEAELQVNSTHPHAYMPITNIWDQELIKSTRITANAVENVLQHMDEMEPLQARRERGRFFTDGEISEIIAHIIREINPIRILEPFVGTGSLIAPLIDEYDGAANDIQSGYIKAMKEEYRDSGWIFTNFDTIETSYEQIFEEWQISRGTQIMILTNPPFGVSSTTRVSAQEGEIVEGNTRNIEISYGGLGDQYGRGDLVMPAIAKCIEIIKRNGAGYFATFSPAGVMLNRNRYRHLFRALVKDFECKLSCVSSTCGDLIYINCIVSI